LSKNEAEGELTRVTKRYESGKPVTFVESVLLYMDNNICFEDSSGGYWDKSLEKNDINLRARI